MNKRFDAYKLPPFGTVLRAYRLRWCWYAKLGAFVRIAPEGEQFSVEVARTFEALSSGDKREYCWGYDKETLNQCEPLQGLIEQDYSEFVVDENGKLVK
jgi:hypothetical protein